MNMLYILSSMDIAQFLFRLIRHWKFLSICWDYFIDTFEGFYWIDCWLYFLYCSCTFSPAERNCFSSCFRAHLKSVFVWENQLINTSNLHFNFIPWFKKRSISSFIYCLGYWHIHHNYRNLSRWYKGLFGHD